MKKKVSVIIPVYNASESLERCVESIVFGEFKNVEVILIEDCSKDNSWDLCQTLSARFKNVQCHRNKKNRGVSYSRNQGLIYADNDYIMFVDSDDWVSGKYVNVMMKAAESRPECLTICGLHYLDKVTDYRRQYLWEAGKEEFCLIGREKFFCLVEQFLLQQLWNKIFRKDVIKKNDLWFDESQSMGEDFQFVLDYIQAAQIKEIMMINQPLYYYIRANNSSLMSKFGLVENDNEFKRLARLRDICGSDNPAIKERYYKAINETKHNYIYQICRNVSVSNEEKIALIEKIARDKNAKIYLKQQKKLILKERTVQTIKDVKTFQERIKGRLRRDKRDYIAQKACRKLNVRDFSIISQNCIGGVFYYDAGMQFLSPTINCFFKEPDFVKFVLKLEYYLSLNLEMHWEEECPVGTLGDISIFFMHYRTCREAEEAWNRRKERINWNKIVVLATDTEGFDEDSWKLWNQIKYPKILFTTLERKGQGVVTYPKYKKNGFVSNLIPDREFYKDGILIKTINALK